MSFRNEDKRTSYFINRRLLSLSSFLLAIAVGLISSFTFSAAYDMARGMFSSKPAAVYGLWHGQWNGVHAVTIRLEQRGETLTGTARFSRIIATDDGPEVVGESPEIPLINPRLRGDSLTFEVDDADGYVTPIVVRMEMRFTGEGEAELWREREEEDESPVIKMLKERSF